MASPAQRAGLPQPAAVTWSQGGTRANARRARLTDWQNPAAKATANMDPSASAANPPSSGTPQPVAGMGPNALVWNPPSMGFPGMGPNAAPFTPGQWDGPLGSVPNHKGWAGLQPSVKDWTLRILGAFPGLRFSSGFRTPAENAAANGDPRSGHMEGWKIDLSGSSNLLAQAAAWAQKYGAKTLLHDAGSGYHLDISFRGVAS